MSSLYLHRLFNHAGELKFTCRVVHSIPLMQSAAQVFCGDQMAAVSHLIGQDQLPLSSHVCTHVCHMYVHVHMFHIRRRN